MQDIDLIIQLQSQSLHIMSRKHGISTPCQTCRKSNNQLMRVHANTNQVYGN